MRVSANCDGPLSGAMAGYTPASISRDVVWPFYLRQSRVNRRVSGFLILVGARLFGRLKFRLTFAANHASNFDAIKIFVVWPKCV